MLQPQHCQHHPQPPSMQFANQPQLQTHLQANIQPQMQPNMQPQMQAHHTCLHHPQMQTQQAHIQAHIQPQIQAHIQPQIQAHIQPQIQAHIPTQLQPQVMLCPVQYIPRMLVPSSPPEDAVQQNQTFQSPATFIINVQNPPPWINSRNAYLPQMQINNMPYIHQNMVQNPMINYYQPMVMEHRVIPNVINQNAQQINQNVPQQVVQNIPSTVQSQPEMKQEPPALHPIPKNAVPSQTQTTRPQYSTIAQMITVNPLSVPQTSEIPQHIRTQLPEGLSVRTYKPPARTEYQSMIAPPVDPRLPKPGMRNSTTNTEPKVKRKKEVDNTNEPTHKRCCGVNQEGSGSVKNSPVNINVDSLPKVDVAAVNNTLRQHSTQLTPNITQIITSVNVPQIEEKLIRNTVFVQARGRVNETVQNELINNKNSQVNDIRLKASETRQRGTNEPSTSKMSNKLQQPKSITLEEEFRDSCASVYVPQSITNENNKQGDIISASSQSKTEIQNANNCALNIKEVLREKINQPTVTESNLTKRDQDTSTFKTISPMFSGNATHLLSNHEKQVFLLTKVIDNKTTTEPKSDSRNIHNNVEESATKIIIPKKCSGTMKSEEYKVVVDKRKLKIDIKILKNNKKENNKEKTTLSIKEQKQHVENSTTKKINNQPEMKMLSTRVGVKNTNERYILTHVLDGHIIQESNEPFQVQKPTPVIIIEPVVAKRKRGRPRKIQKEVEPPMNTRETRLSFNMKKDKLFNINRQLAVSLCRLENNRKHTESKNDKGTASKPVEPVVEKPTVKAEESEPVVETKKPTKEPDLEAKETVANRSSDSVSKETILKQVFNKGSVKTQRSNAQSESLEAKETVDTDAVVEEPSAGQTKATLENRVPESNAAIYFEEAIDNAVDRLAQSIRTAKEISDTVVEAKISHNETKKSTDEPKLEQVEDKTDCNGLLNENEDNPFDKVSKSALKSWSVSDVTSHLTTHDWCETAQLLGDQEIDGESLLLASKEQLLLIGIDENQAQVISDFIEGGTDTEDNEE